MKVADLVQYLIEIDDSYMNSEVMILDNPQDKNPQFIPCSWGLCISKVRGESRLVFTPVENVQKALIAHPEKIILTDEPNAHKKDKTIN